MLNTNIIKRKMSNSKKLVFAKLFFAFGLAAVDTVWSIYMDSFGLSESTIGFISAILVFLTLLAALFATPILEYFRQSKILLVSLFLSALAYLIIALTHNLWLFLSISAMLAFLGILRSDSFNIIFRDSVKSKDLNKEEGFFYTVDNIGWLLGPFIAGYLIYAFNISTVFLAISLFMLLSFFSFLLIHLKSVTKKREFIDKNIIINMKSFLVNKRFRLPYLMVIGNEIWWALVYIYMPLFMIHNSINPAYVGLFIGAIAIPLVLFEGFVGKSSYDYGFKFFFSLGFFGLAIISLLSFLFSEIHIQIGLVVFGSVFAACLEPIRETYFFRQVRRNEEEKFYPIFWTSSDIGGIFGKVLFASVLLLFTYEYVFLLLFILMGIFALLSLKVKGH